MTEMTDTGLPQEETIQLPLPELLERADALDKEIAETDKKLKELKEQKRVLEEHDMPAALKAMGVKKFTDDNDVEYSLVHDIYPPYVKKEDQPTFYGWMVDHGFGPLIKSEIKTTFGAGDIEKADEIAKLLQEQGCEVASSQSIHSATLKKFAKERFEADEELPECLTVKPRSYVRVKKPKGIDKES